MRRIFALATALAILITGLTALPSWASAPVNGTYDCNTGLIQNSPSDPSYTILNGAVSGGAGCTGIVAIAPGALSIDAWAFTDAGDVTQLNIPASVTSISTSAFGLNSHLATINFDGNIPAGWPWSGPAGVRVSGKVDCGTTGYFVISDNTVVGRRDCTGSVVIPEGVTAIGGEAFDAAGGYGGGVGRENPFGSTIGTNITSLTIPNTVTSIGWFAFRETHASSIVIPDSVTSIGIYAFASSTATSLTIGNGLSTISGGVFLGMNNLTSLTLGSGVRTIEGEAFRYDRSLTSVTIPDTVESIGINAFSDSGYPFAANYCGNANLAGTGLPNPSSNASSCVPAPPRDLTAIPGNGSARLLFTPGASGASAITNYKYSLDGVNYTLLSPAVTSSPVTISGLTNGTAYRVYLKAVSASGDSAPVSAQVFPRLTGQVSVPADGTYNCNTGAPTSSTPNYTITSGSVHDGYACVGAVVVANGATSLGYWAFGYAPSVTSVYIPETVTSILDYSFANDDSLFAINVADDNANYLSIAGVLYNKDRTTLIRYPQARRSASYAIPSGVTRIEDFAFHKAASLTSVTMPSGLTYIGNRSFQETGLTSVSIPEGVTSIGLAAFEKAYFLTSASLPNSLTSFGEAVFRENISLASVNIPNSITVIPNYAFYYDTALTAITLPGGVTSIGDLAFASATSLASINFPVGLRTIGVAAFSGTAITSVVLPEGFTTIGSNAFQWDSGITTVTLPSTLRSIGEAAFYGVSNLTQVTIPDGVEDIGSVSFHLTGSPFTLYYCGNASLSGTGLPTQAANASSCRPAPPTQVTATAGVGSATIAFTPGIAGGSAITGYKYSLDGTNYSAFSPALTSASGTLTGLTNGTTYNVYLKAVSALGESVASARVSVTPIASAYSNASIAGVAAPVYGATPVRSGISGTGYTGTVSWSGSPTTFAGATSYTATITLTPVSGYTFTGVAANFFTVAGATSVSNPAGSGLITAVFPATDSAAYSDATISGVTAPVLGATPVTSGISGNGYTGTVSWSGNPTTFAGATSYTATITLTPDSGYTFTGVAANYFSVAGATSVSNSANSGLITAVFPVTDSRAYVSASILGVTRPVSGDSPVTAVTSTSTYTGTVSWSGSPATFGPGTSYTATITLTPRSGYTFAGVTANYFTLAGATSVSNDANSGVITAVFPATGDVPGAPTNAVATRTGSTTATVTFVPPASDGGSAITGYSITAYGDTMATVTTSANNHSASFTGLLATSDYSFLVTAINSAGISVGAWSNLIPPAAYDPGTGTGSVSCVADGQTAGAGYFMIDSNVVIYATEDCQGAVVIPTGVTEIAPHVFEGAGGITSVTIPGSVLTIGVQAFSALDQVTTLNIAAGVTTIGEEAFSGLSSLTTLVIPNSVTTLGEGAFEGLSHLTSLRIGTGITAIPNFAFMGLTLLAELAIPDSVTTIGLASFYQAEHLTEVVIPENVTAIGVAAFGASPSITWVSIPAGVTSLGDYAFGGAAALESVYFFGNAPTVAVGDVPFESVLSGAEAVVTQDATDFTEPTWQGLNVRRVANVQHPVVNHQQQQQDNNQQQQQSLPVAANQAPLPKVESRERQRVSTNGQTLTLEGSNLDGVRTITINGKEAKINKKSSGELVIQVPAGIVGFPEVVITSAAGVVTIQGLIQVVAPYADKRTAKVTVVKNGQLSSASLAALKKSYKSAQPANVISCSATVASNASSKDVALARKSAKGACQTMVEFSSYINTVSVQVNKTGRAGSKLTLAVTFDRTLTGK